MLCWCLRYGYSVERDDRIYDLCTHDAKISSFVFATPTTTLGVPDRRSSEQAPPRTASRTLSFPPIYRRVLLLIHGLESVEYGRAFMWPASSCPVRRLDHVLYGELCTSTYEQRALERHMRVRRHDLCSAVCHYGHGTSVVWVSPLTMPGLLLCCLVRPRKSRTLLLHCTSSAVILSAET